MEKSRSIVAKGQANLPPLLRGSLFANAFYFMLHSGTTALLGFGFWAAAARLYPAETVGFASALISAAGFLAFISGQGLEFGLVRVLPDRREQAIRLLNTVMLGSGLVALVAAGVFLAGIPLWSPALAAARADPFYVVAFLLAVPAVIAQSLVQGAFFAARRASFVLAVGILGSGVRLVAAVAAVAVVGSYALFGAWVLAVLLVVVVGVVVLVPHLYPGRRFALGVGSAHLRDLVRFSLLNHLTLLFWTAPTYLIPLILANTLGLETNAYYFMALSLAGLVWSVPLSVSVSLLAEGANEPDALVRHIRHSLALTIGIMIPVSIFAWFAGYWLLLLFGRDYAVEGIQSLRFLVLAGVPMSLNYLYLSIKRVEKRMAGPIALTLTVAVATMGWLVLMQPALGITAAGTAPLVGHGLAALGAATHILIEQRRLIPWARQT